MVEKGETGGRQFDPTHAAGKQRDADFALEVADLATERRLRSVQPLFRRELQASGLGDRDEVAKMSELHVGLLYLLGISISLSGRRRSQGNHHLCEGR